MTEYKGFGLTEHPLTNHFERHRGIFTPKADRPFLINHEGAPSDRTEYARHERIRDRLLHGILDFQLAQRHLDDWNWRKLLDMDTTEEREIRNSMTAAMALFYEIHREKNWSFHNTLHHAVDEAYSTGVVQRTMPNRHLENVDLEIETSEPAEYGADLERVAQKIVENAELTDREVRFAASKGWYDALERYFSKENYRERSKETRIEDIMGRISIGEFEKRWEQGE
jgi:hypothetical protein